MKVVFFGTPEYAVPSLQAIINSRHKVVAVVSQPDKPVGRSNKLVPTPIKKLAMETNIPVFQYEKIRKEDISELLNIDADIFVTCAYGQIIPKELLDAPRLGCINVHASLLPRLRGGAPIQKAIIDGHTKTGITIMYMDEKMDSGDIIKQREIPIEYEDTAESLHDKLAILGRDLLLETLPSIIEETNERIKQDEIKVTYAPTIKREDERLDFNLTQRQIYNKVRGLYSWPGAYCTLDGKILKIWKCRETDNVFSGLINGTITNIYEDGFGIKVANGEIVVTYLQLEGKKKMLAKDFVNGYPNLKGKIVV